MLTLFNLWQQEMLSLIDVSSVAENGNFYPTLLLCLKELETLKGQVGILICNFFFLYCQLILRGWAYSHVFFPLCVFELNHFQFLLLWRFKVFPNNSCCYWSAKISQMLPVVSFMLILISRCNWNKVLSVFQVHCQTEERYFCLWCCNCSFKCEFWCLCLVYLESDKEFCADLLKFVEY